MRLAVRHQLSILLVLSSTVGLATLAIATWCANHSFVLRVAQDGLETAASLKAVELAISLDLMYTSCLYLAANGPVQHALKRYNNGTDISLANWNEASEDMAAALNSLGSLQHTPGVQSQLRARNTSGPAGHESVLNITGSGNEGIALPWPNGNGGSAELGKGDSGYPPGLYPNLTISKTDHDILSYGSYIATYKEQILGLGSNLILGPLIINRSYSLMSMTVPVVDNYSETNILGWLTVVQTTRLLQALVQDETGLGKTGLTLLLGPTNTDNQFAIGASAEHEDVRFLLPVRPDSTKISPSFAASAYPAVEAAISDGFHGKRELGSMLSTYNENGKSIAAAYATPDTKLVNWIVVVEQSTSEFWDPVDQLRTIILACLFSVLGFFFFASLPIAHWAVRPITRLKAATEVTIDPLYRSSNSTLPSIERGAGGRMPVTTPASSHRNGFFGSLMVWRQRDHAAENQDRRVTRFRIPSKVDTSKHWVRDDLSDLMDTFNEMSDELFMQYTKLEDRVRQRTFELELSKKAAEAANESKTMFVANVSHELKTPLNGILGMCATSIEDDDVSQMKTSLSIIYKSGDLLLRTLNDLLTFSTNQSSRELMLEEREFTLQDLESQVLTIFEKQAIEKGITLRFECDESSQYLMNTSVKLMDMTLWGDVHRILQILINLVSNSMKYTPKNGSVTFAVRRSPDTAPRRLVSGLEQASLQSRRTQKTSTSLAGRSEHGGTANFINPVEGQQLQERSVAPPGNDLYLEFEVRDTGEGIPEDMQTRIFEPFVQGEVGLSRRHSGTGLGLSICSQLTALMRGNISLKSMPGVGSTFTVKVPLRHVIAIPSSRPSTDPAVEIAQTISLPSSSIDTEKIDRVDYGKDAIADPVTVRLPLENEKAGILADVTGEPKALKSETKYDTAAIAPPATPPEPMEPAPTVTKKPRKRSNGDELDKQHDFSKLRVLVAEDNKINQQVILRMLKMEQILQVTLAEDGQEALDVFKGRQELEATEQPPFNLVFMDVQMPNVDGLTSTRLIRETGFSGPIVALTAFAEKTNIDDCYQAGMNHFLAKPLKKLQLHEVLIKFGVTN